VKISIFHGIFLFCLIGAPIPALFCDDQNTPSNSGSTKASFLESLKTMDKKTDSIRSQREKPEPEPEPEHWEGEDIGTLEGPVAFVGSEDDENFPGQTVAEPKSLEFYRSVAAFEKALDAYSQNCLDNTGGGTGGIGCCNNSAAWRDVTELYAQRLQTYLDKSHKGRWTEVQKNWDESLALSSKLDVSLTDRNYAEQGTAMALIRSCVEDDDSRSVEKSRALIVRNWARLISKKSFLKDGIDRPEEDSAALDRKLDSIYRELMLHLNSDRQALLKDSEKAWLKNRDSIESFSALLPATAGREELLSYNQKVRVDQLQQWLEKVVEKPLPIKNKDVN
jgi:hypothetical protein